jgi:hypothetical protein
MLEVALAKWFTFTAQDAIVLRTCAADFGVCSPTDLKQATSENDGRRRSKFQFAERSRRCTGIALAADLSAQLSKIFSARAQVV